MSATAVQVHGNFTTVKIIIENTGDSDQLVVYQMHSEDDMTKLFEAEFVENAHTEAEYFRKADTEAEYFSLSEINSHKGTIHE